MQYQYSIHDSHANPLKGYRKWAMGWAIWIIMMTAFPFFATASESDPLSIEEREWLKAHDGKLKVGFLLNTPPVDFSDKDGKFSGIAADYFYLLQEKLEFEFGPTIADNWENTLRKLQNRQIDIHFDVNINSTREKYLLFSKMYLEIPIVIVMKSNVTHNFNVWEMQGMKIAVEKNVNLHSYLEKNYGFLNLIPFIDPERCLLETATGRVDATIIQLPIASYFIQNEGIVNLKVAGYLDLTDRYHIASRKDWPILNRILNKGLGLITEEEKEAIYQKWIHPDYVRVPIYKKRSFQITVGLIVFVAGTAIILILIWNRKLKRMVAERSTMLEDRKSALKDEIIEKKSAETALIEKQIQLESILENVRGMSYRCLNDEVYTAIHYGNQIEQICGYPASDFINNNKRTFVSIVHPDDFPAVNETIQKSIENGKAWKHEYRVLHRDGSVKWVLACCTAFYTPAGKVDFLEGIILDITQKKMMESHLGQSQKMESIGLLAAGIAHDFNNILGGIIGFSELLEEDLKDLEDANAWDNPEDPDALDVIHALQRKNDVVMAEGMRAKELVAQILAFSRSQGQSGEIVNVGLVAEEVVRLLSASLPATIDIRLNTQSKARIVADSNAIHQILMNLCTNAGQAMKKEGGKLTISLKDILRDQQSFMCISVEDTGHGMDEATLNRIRAPFFTTKSKEEGTGMGLWVVQEILEELGGFMDVSSIPGKGSSFHIYLPTLSKVKTGNADSPENAFETINRTRLMGNERILCPWPLGRKTQSFRFGI